MEKRFLIVLIILSALVIACTDSKSRKRRQASRSTLSSHHKAVLREQCFSEKCLRKSRAAYKAEHMMPPIKLRRKRDATENKSTPNPKTTKKPAKSKQSSVKKAGPKTTKVPKPVTPVKTTARPAAKQKIVQPVKPADKLKAAQPSVKSNKPAEKVQPVKPAKLIKPVNNSKPVQPVALTKPVEKSEPAVIKHARKGKDTAPQKLYVSQLFIEEEIEPKDLSYKRPLRESDRDDDRLPPGERELTVQDLEDRVITSDFARKPHFIKLDESVGLRRAVMTLLFVVIVMPAAMLLLIHCCTKKESKKVTEEEKYMESLLSQPLLSQVPTVQPGVHSNCRYQGDSNQNYQSNNSCEASSATPSVTVWVPPV